MKINEHFEKEVVWVSVIVKANCFVIRNRPERDNIKFNVIVGNFMI